MKRTLLTLSAALLALAASASPVSVETARQAAINQYRHYAPAEVADFAVRNVYTNVHEGEVTFYTFTFEAGGFVMISADDAASPVLGYSHEGDYAGNVSNPAVDAWCADYSKQIALIRDQKISNAATLPQWEALLAGEFAKGGQAVSPLFNYSWDQGAGWDTYVPANTPVGCVALAMSMIMRYYEYPATGASWHSYTCAPYGEQTAYFFQETYDYANMPAQGGSNAAAILCRHAGVAVNMNYSPSGSGALSPDVPIAMANYFRYSHDIQYVEKESYSTTEWVNLLKGELDASRPIYYSGSDATQGGHAFLFLGYNDNNQFYVNWGWRGSGNGYFAVGSLNPTGYAFNSGNGAVINIKPAEAGEEQFLWVEKNTRFPQTSAYPGYISAPDATTAWATGRDGSGSSASLRTYTVTVDGGATWSSKTLNHGDDFSMIYGVDANTAFIAAHGSGAGNKILKTTNRGETWDVVLTGGGSSSFFNVVHFFDANNGFVQGDPLGGYYELYTTTDGGANWTRVPQANIPAPVNSAEYGIVGYYTAVGDVIWYSTNNGYVYKSTDKGYNWTKHQIYAATGNNVNATIAFSDDCMTGLCTAYDDGNYRRLKTSDGGVTWTDISTTAPANFYKQDVSAVPGTNGMFVSAGSDYQTPAMGLSYTMDGGDTWQEFASYYSATQFPSVTMVSATKGYAGTFQGDVNGGMFVMGGVSQLAAGFTVDANRICVNEGEIVVTNTSFGDYTEITWNFGEGATPATANTEGPHTVSYSTPGQKTISVTIVSGGNTVTEEKENIVTVLQPPTSVDFSYSANVNNPAFITFTSESEGVEPGATYIWELGNGVVLERTVPTVMYNFGELGTWEVTLTIRNTPEGCAASGTNTVTNVVGIEETLASRLAVYPNPASDVIYIAGAMGARYEMFAIDGRLVSAGAVTADSHMLDVAGMQSGVYSVKVTMDNVTTTTMVQIR